MRAEVTQVIMVLTAFSEEAGSTRTKCIHPMKVLRCVFIDLPNINTYNDVAT